jgi:sterol desaturase/sphingolipid hydroxylase (fatty acid hydroxylase superfamily)
MLHQLITILSVSSLVVVIFYLAELLGGKARKLSASDIIIDLSTFVLPDVLLDPTIVMIVAWGTATLLPGKAGALANTPVWLQFVAFLVFEDMVNYWWHRCAHTFPKLMWPMHLAHHTPTYMSATICRRNSFLYTFLFPNRYFAAVLVYLGYGETFVWYSAIKNVVLTGAHSDLRWDSFLYRYKFLEPVAWLVERTISTPATHFAHHAQREDDGIGFYNGNYSNLLFFWDVLFGTAKITRKYPLEFGVVVDPVTGPEPWYVQLFYPLLSRTHQAAAEPAPMLSER